MTNDSPPTDPFEGPLDDEPLAKASPVQRRMIARPTYWPQALGGVQIVFGILGVLGGAFGLLMLTQLPSLPDGAPARGNPTLDVMEKYSVLFAAFNAVAILLAAWLVIAGNATVHRRPSAMRLSNAWAMYKILFVIVLAAANHNILQDLIDRIIRLQPDLEIKQRNWMKNIQTYSSLIIFIWGCALPLFLRRWYERQNIQDEVAGWARASEPLVEASLVVAKKRPASTSANRRSVDEAQLHAWLSDEAAPADSEAEEPVVAELLPPPPEQTDAEQ